MKYLGWLAGALGALFLGAPSSNAQTVATFGRLSGPPPAICVYDQASPPLCNPFMSVDNATHAVTIGAGTADIAGHPRSLQSFGAVGNGVADDTAAVQTALNSGIPLTCRGTFKLAGLVTVANKNVFIKGGAGGCAFLLSTSQSMIYADQVGGDLYTTVQVTMEDVKFIVQAVITSVTGPAKTAALYVTYSSGTAGITTPTVTLTNVQVKPDSATNYILNGIYLNDATNARLTNVSYEGNRTTVDPNSSAIVYDGTNSPSALFVTDGHADFAGRGVYAPPVAATGWHGIRIQGVDCVFCGYIVDLQGSNDSTSDYADIQSTEGAFVIRGIRVINVAHVDIHDNYVFNRPAAGIANPVFPICYELAWTIAIPTNAANGSIAHNTCDSSQAIGYVSRYGVSVSGTSGTDMNTVIGPNTLSALEFGWQLNANTAGVEIYPQILRFVGAAFENTSGAGANTIIQFPSAYAAYNTNTATFSITLTAANISGAAADVTLNMTGILSAGANATLPTVASLVAALPNPAVGQSYRLEIINTSTNNFAWTVVTNTGWTLAGAMTIEQNFKRTFVLTLTSLTAGTLQSIGRHMINPV